MFFWVGLGILTCWMGMYAADIIWWPFYQRVNTGSISIYRYDPYRLNPGVNYFYVLGADEYDRLYC